MVVRKFEHDAGGGRLLIDCSFMDPDGNIIEAVYMAPEMYVGKE
jgi:predicted lactoylglutathione lyase